MHIQLGPRICRHKVGTPSLTRLRLSLFQLFHDVGLFLADVWRQFPFIALQRRRDRFLSSTSRRQFLRHRCRRRRRRHRCCRRLCHSDSLLVVSVSTRILTVLPTRGIVLYRFVVSHQASNNRGCYRHVVVGRGSAVFNSQQ